MVATWHSDDKKALVLPPVQDTRPRSENEPEIYRLHEDDLEDTVYVPVKYSEERLAELTAFNERCNSRVLEMESRPDSQWAQVDIQVSPPPNTKTLTFDASIYPNKKGFHVFRMKTEITGWNPKEIIDKIFAPENIPDFSAVTWANTVLHNEGDVRTTYSTIYNVDGTYEDVVASANRFKAGEDYYCMVVNGVPPHLCPECPERENIKRLRDMLSYFCAFKEGNRTMVHVGVERNVAEVSYNRAVHPQIVPLPVAVFHRFFLEFLSSRAPTSQNSDPSQSNGLSSRVFRQVLFGAVHMPMWELVYAEPNVQMWSKMCNKSNVTKLGLKALILADASVNKVWRCFVHNANDWLPGDCSATLVSQVPDIRYVYDLVLPGTYTSLDKDYVCRISMSCHELNSSHYVCAFTSIRPATEDDEMQENTARIEFEPSGLFMHAMSKDKCFMNVMIVFNLNSLCLDLDRNEEGGGLKADLRNLGLSVHQVFESFVSYCNGEARNNPDHGPTLSSVEVAGVLDVVNQQRDYISMCVNRMRSQEAEMMMLKELVRKLAGENRAVQDFAVPIASRSCVTSEEVVTSAASASAKISKPNSSEVSSPKKRRRR